MIRVLLSWGHDNYFYPYAKAFEGLTGQMLETFGKCFILDAHSFPTLPLPYENAKLNRPGICFGYGAFHMPRSVVQRLEATCELKHYTSARNEPFAGSYVPLKYFQKDSRIKSLMIEVRRGTYMDESNGEKSNQFDLTKGLITEFIEQIVDHL